MPKWFAAIFLIVNSSKGVSSVALGRQIGVGQKTAWLLGQRIRAMLDTDADLLRGVVEADETYVGGERRKGQKSKRDPDDEQPKGRGGTKKLMVVTAVERGGKAKARKGKTHSARSIARAVYDSRRKFACVDCGHEMDRDENAAVNLYWYGEERRNRARDGATSVEIGVQGSGVAADPVPVGEAGMLTVHEAEAA